MMRSHGGAGGGGRGQLCGSRSGILRSATLAREAVANLADRGVRQILVVPYFLTLGIHLQRDLPGMVDRSRKCIRMWRFADPAAGWASGVDPDSAGSGKCRNAGMRDLRC